MVKDKDKVEKGRRSQGGSEMAVIPLTLRIIIGPDVIFKFATLWRPAPDLIFTFQTLLLSKTYRNIVPQRQSGVITL